LVFTEISFNNRRKALNYRNFTIRAFNCMNTNIQMPVLSNSWKKVLNNEFDKDYMKKLHFFLESEVQQGAELLPQPSLWFNALNSTPLDQVKVVVLGQDPYPTPGHAHGLCFSVLPEVRPLPKSLKNIYTELNDDLGIMNTAGNLQHWADQGVLMLNSVLTVASGEANSHQGKGWEHFTDRIISVVNDLDRAVVFVLWGAYAQKKGAMISEFQHLVIRSPHPSPLSAYRGFYGSKPFSQINAFLVKHKQSEIDWHVD
jgi:uracil-DNA glycosylase